MKLIALDFITILKKSVWVLLLRVAKLHDINKYFTGQLLQIKKKNWWSESLDSTFMGFFFVEKTFAFLRKDYCAIQILDHLHARLRSVTFLFLLMPTGQTSVY